MIRALEPQSRSRHCGPPLQIGWLKDAACLPHTLTTPTCNAFICTAIHVVGDMRCVGRLGGMGASTPAWLMKDMKSEASEVSEPSSSAAPAAVAATRRPRRHRQRCCCCCRCSCRCTRQMTSIPHRAGQAGAATLLRLWQATGMANGGDGVAQRRL